MEDIKECEQLSVLGNVNIDIDRYNYLIRTEEKYRILTDALLNGASLDMYSKDRLVYNGNDIDTVLKALEGDDYECVLDSLNGGRQEKNKREYESMEFRKMLSEEEEGNGSN